MSIQLENFRCHTNGKYEIPSSGLISITGSSGQGKSSLLNAVVYALYGSKLIRRPYTHGKKSCKVVFDFEGMNITRTSSPNRLLLKYKNKDYEDAAAQGVIEQVIGMNYNEFLVSSYIVQRKNNSVLSMSPLEQVKFIETLAFSNNKHLEYKEKFRKHILLCKEEKNRLEGQKSLLETQINDAKQRLPEKKITNSYKDKNIKDIVKEQEKTQYMLEETSEKSSKLQKELAKKREYETKSKVIHDKIQSLESQIASYEELKTSPIEAKDIEKKRKECEELRKLLFQNREYKSYKELDDKVKKMQKDHLERLRKELATLKKDCPSKTFISKLEKEKVELNKKQKESIELASQAEEMQKRKKTALKEVKNIKKETGAKVKSSVALFDFLKEKETKLESEYSKLKEELESQIYKCPSCSKNLQLKEGKLCICKSNQSSKISYSELKAKTSTVFNELEKIKQYVARMEEYKPHLNVTIPEIVPFDSNKITEIEKKLCDAERVQETICKLSTDIKNKNFPPSIKDLQRDVKNKNNFPKDFKPSKIEEIEKKLEDCSSKFSELNRQKSENMRIEKEIRTRNNKIKILRDQLGKDSKLKTKTCADIEKEVSLLQNKCLDYSKKLKELREIYSVLSKHEEYNRELENVKKAEENLSIVEENLKKAIEKVTGALGLQESAKEAEILSLEHTVNSINEHAKIYLQEMFSDTIHISLENQKLTKTQNVKTQMNVNIEYKGYKYNNIDELSGGEKQRCELAFLLAVNDMLGSKMILLDECLNNLDSEVNMDVLLQLKRLVGNKLVMVVSHEAVQGIFDSTIEI